jgi:hypothetical protein
LFVQNSEHIKLYPLPAGVLVLVLFGCVLQVFHLLFVDAFFRVSEPGASARLYFDEM